MKAIATYILLPFSLALFAQPDHPQTKIESRMLATNTNWKQEIGITFGGGLVRGRIGSVDNFATSTHFNIGIEVEPLNNLFLNPSIISFPFATQNPFFHLKYKVNNIGVALPVIIAGDKNPVNIGIAIGPVVTFATNQVVNNNGKKERYELNDHVNRVNAGIQVVPQIRLRTAITDVAIQAGTTMMLGNVFKFSNQQNKTVPLLGHISIIGKLFTNRSHQRERDNLLILIKPSIIKSED